MNKLTVCIMGQNCKRFIEMCYESVKSADHIVFCDGGSSDGTIEYLKSKGFKWEPVPITDKNYNKTLIYQTYNQEIKQMNGRQRNFYLDYLKEKFPNDWALCIDADEVVEDLSKLKQFIQTAKPGIYSPRMRHFIGDLGHEDATRTIHPVINRLFKIDQALGYLEVEHPVLNGENISNEIVMDTTIWHLAYIPNLWEIKRRYDNHIIKSDIHTPEFLRQWRNAHLFGRYPKTPINVLDIPNIILKNFEVDKDEFYFENRGLETKHFIDASNWKQFFSCNTATEFGCGLGPRVYAMNCVGIRTNGLEISKFAVEHKLHPNIIQCDVSNSFSINQVDLVVAYDLLEHIPYDKLDHVIENLIKSTKKHILLSIPFLGDPNLEADPTHIIKESRDWWIEKFTSKGLKLIQTPDYFQYKNQILIFNRNI